jgi:dihydroorotase
VGAEADIALIDPEKPWVVDSNKMAASAGNTPFDKQPVQGRVVGLWKGGAAVGE